MEQAVIKQIELELDINAPIGRVWNSLLNELPVWWPGDFLGYPEGGPIKFEPHVGGRLYEQTEDGKSLLWSTVIAIAPEKSMDFIGYMTPAFGGPTLTMLHLELEADGDAKTKFKMTDSLLGRVSEEGEASMNQGWSYLFGAFKAHCEKG
ncbi:MAG: SRPBCC domain-containing protein [Fimbriimonadaceae bacterium]|nr:SRPBCC domain-containing protein [Fimbriimonadaceae bacterium]